MNDNFFLFMDFGIFDGDCFLLGSVTVYNLGSVGNGNWDDFVYEVVVFEGLYMVLC